ncbi:MAG: BACON domain-containing protein [Bryobacteraceae bacterium]
MISASPDLLHIYDPATAADVTITLPKTPLSLGVTPDGSHAAVGHDGLLTWIDLTSGSIIKTFTVSGTVGNIILGDSYAWVFLPGNGYTGGMSGLNLSSGTPVTSPGLSYYYATDGVLNATQTALYLSQDGSSPNDMEEVQISSGQLGNPTTWPYHGDYPDCGPYYLSVDGSRVYTSCGTVVHSSADSSIDMYYLRSLPVASGSIVSFAESASLKEIAVIPAVSTFEQTSTLAPDTQVQLFDTQYLTPAGYLSLLPFMPSGNSFAAHGKGVYFSKDNTRLFVLVQADSTSNLSNPFAVEVINLADPVACPVQLGQNTTSIGAWGSLGVVSFTAAADCIYNASTSTPWISLTEGAYGSGSGAVQFVARPNYSAQARAGSIAINGSTYSIQQGGAPGAYSSFVNLSVNAVDAAYSAALDKMIIVSTLPDELHIYDPVSTTDSFVPLIMPPLAVSVSPDGLHAAVGHDGWISYVDLKAQSVQQVFQIVTDVHHVLAAGNGYIYAFPQRDWSPIYSLETANGNVTGTSAIYEGRIPRLEPNGKYFYLGGDGWFSKWDITNGVAVSIEDSPGSENVGNNFWLFQDGSQLIADDGKVYATSDVPAQDMQYTGAYPNINSITWAANASAVHSTAIIPASPGDTQALLFGDAYLEGAGEVTLPQFPAGGSSYAGHGLFVFWNSGANALYVLERADPSSQLTSTDAVYSLSHASGCSAAPVGALPTIPAGGGFGSAIIDALTDCLWTASSDSSWLTITAGAIGAGSASLSWSATANTGTANRSGHISVGQNAYPITQLGTTATALTLSTTSMTFSAAWSSATPVAPQSFSVQSGTGPFTVTAYPSWIKVTSASATGFSVSINLSGIPAGTQTGEILVSSSDGQTQPVVVTLTVTPQLVATPAKLSFQYSQGGQFPSATVSVGDGTASGSSFSVYGYGSGLTVTPVSGTLPATIKITPAINTAGTFTYDLGIYGGTEEISVPVTITVMGLPVSVSAITSAADFSQGPISPGEIVVIWGNGMGPANLTPYAPGQAGRVPIIDAGTTVTFDNYPAPIIYSSAGAVCALVPYEVAGQSSASVVVSYGGSASPAFTQQLAPTAPHFFTKTDTPAGQIAGFNSDYTLNSASNPAPAGSIVVLYATGEGVVSPPGIDGTLVGSNLTQPLANVSAMVGGQAADVIYAGGSPGSVEGLFQINLRIPGGTASGSAPVSLQIGANSSPVGATIAVK